MMFSIFKRNKNKKKNKKDKSIEALDTNRKDESGRSHVAVEICEQMIDASRELENIRDEYKLVTYYLNDIQTIEDLPSEERKKLSDVAGNIVNLNKVRDGLLETKNRISDSQFAQMQDDEQEVLAAIKRLEANETYLSAIERDMHTLEGEKLSWEIDRKDYKYELRQLRRISIMLFALFTTVIAVYLILTFVFDTSYTLWTLIIAFFITIGGAYSLIRYQDCLRDIKQCEVNINHTITLENHVKIKYVNIKNAVDYACEKYHVKNSKELVYNYEQYQEAVKERRKFKEANDDLIYYNEKLVRLLREYNLYDSKVWTNYPHAICDKKEMVEVKHNLIVRRQKLRARMEYNLENLSNMRDEALANIDENDRNYLQIESIIKRLDEINQNAL